MPWSDWLIAVLVGVLVAVIVSAVWDRDRS